MKRRLLRWALGAFVLMTILYLGACQAVDYFLSSQDDAGLPRDTIETDTPWTLSYLHAGDPAGPRLIYVHGTPGSATNFTAYLKDPIPGWESISIDRPGFGKTKPLRPAKTLAEQAKAIEPFLVERNGRWPILIGHSMGAPIIARAAIDYPGRVGALVILSGSMSPELERVYWIQWIANFGFMPYLIPKALRMSNAEVLPLKAELKILEPQLQKIKCPIVIVHAKDDSLVPYENVAFMRETFPEDRIVHVINLEDGDHFLPWNSEEKIREAILRVIDAE